MDSVNENYFITYKVTYMNSPFYDDTTNLTKFDFKRN